MVSLQRIIDEAIKNDADIIGVSGLITPSLDEMVNFTKEAERQGLKLPILIGGATTSRIHAAVKVAPNYSGPLVHVLDASRSVGVCSNLLNKETQQTYTDTIRAEYDRAREAHLKKRNDKRYISIEDARKNHIPIKWKNYLPQTHCFLGTRDFKDYPLEELLKTIE